VKQINKAIISATKIFKQGGIIAYPTEAVFGLGCDPNNDSAIKTLLAIKQRSVDKGLILLASDYSQLQPYIDEQVISAEQLIQIKARWPAAITQIMPAKAKISPLLTGGRNTIAVRITDHVDVVALCQRTQQAIISTSANISGQQTAKTWQQVTQQFGEQVDYLIKGKTLGLAQPSQIIDALSGKVLRS